MASNDVKVIDSDGHLVESIPEMAGFLDPGVKEFATNPPRARNSIFPGLDGIHYPESDEHTAAKRSHQILASDHRKGSGEDIFEFVKKAEMQDSVLYTSEGLSVGFIQQPTYAVRVCRAYNDYVTERYRGISPRLHPVALLPMQDPKAASLELRRAVKELGLPGGMLPATGLSLHLAHEYYWPVYEAAANLGCVLGVHGGSNRGCGLDTFTNRLASRLLHHPLPLMRALTGMIYSGLFDRYPALKVAFLEGGCGWLVPIADRMERDAELEGVANRSLPDYLTSGQILIGCEGNDVSLPYLAKRLGVEPFAYSSDYPHEVDLPAAQKMIDETRNHAELSQAEKAAVLGGNAARFYGL
ncbi:MAG: amidohydrolase family protein [Candidatus Binatia bacterium]